MQIVRFFFCFSALDSASEFQVQEALERVMKGRSVITIAHRISTIQNSGQFSNNIYYFFEFLFFYIISIPSSFFTDTISVLQNGKIVEQGSYENLLQIENGHFKSLVRK